MAVIITHVMATDKDTEELLCENERKSVKRLDIFTNQATESEPSQVNSELKEDSSSSLYSQTESVSIPMSDSDISTDKDVDTNCDADDREYMCVNIEEGGNCKLDMM